MEKAVCSDRLHIFAVCIRSHFGFQDLFLMVLGDLTLRPIYFSIHIHSTVPVIQQQPRMSCLLNMDETPIYLSYHFPVPHSSLLLTAVFPTSIPKLSATSSPSIETISNFWLEVLVMCIMASSAPSWNSTIRWLNQALAPHFKPTTLHRPTQHSKSKVRMSFHHLKIYDQINMSQAYPEHHCSRSCVQPGRLTAKSAMLPSFLMHSQTAKTQPYSWYSLYRRSQW